MARLLSVALWLVLPAPAVAQEISLADLAREALEHNPEILRMEERVRMLEARVPQAGALPDPVLMSGVINEGRPVPLETLGTADFSEVYLGFAQALPFPGKRGLREQVARSEVDAERALREETRRQVIRAVAEAYHDLQAQRATSALVEESLAWTDRLARDARERFAVGQGMQQDALRAELELSRLEERRSLLEEQGAQREALLARLLGGSAAPDLGRLAPLARTQVPGALEDLLQRAEQASPLLQEQHARMAAAARRVELARRERLPDFAVELVYHDRGRRELDPFYSLGATVTLPLHATRKQERAVDEAAAELRAAHRALDASRAELRYAVAAARVRAESSARRLRLYDEGLLAQSRLVVDSALARYRVGQGDLGAVLASRQHLLDDEIAYTQECADHERAVVELEIELGSSALVPPSALAEAVR